MEHVFAHEHLVGNADDFIPTVFIEKDYIIDIRAVANELVLLQSCSYEALRAVDIQLLVGFCHLCCDNRFEVFYLRAPLVVATIFILNELEPSYGDYCHTT